ncbi:MAG: glycosyltransferase, partial [Myxococcota bacterium]
MKVVDVAEFYAEKGGGVKTYLDQKLRAGSAAGHEVVVLAPGPEDAEEERHGGRVVWIKSPKVPGDPRYHLFIDRRAVHAALDRERPNVVEGSSVYGGGW